MLSPSCQEVCSVSVKRYFFLPLILLLSLLTCCAPKTETEGSDLGPDGTVLDPSAYRNTVWLGQSEARNERLLIDEEGSARIMLASEMYYLRPAGDSFILESHLYRTLFDEEPALVMPVGKANILSDGSVCRFEMLSDDMGTFYKEQETILFYRSKSDPKEDRRYFIDYGNAMMIPHAQPNTRWSDWYPLNQTVIIDLAADANGAVSGTCTVDGKTMDCELLIGHRGWDNFCALVKQGAQSAEDVLLFGRMDKSYNRRFARRFELTGTYDPYGVCGEKGRCTLSKQITFDFAERNWLGMSLYELMFKLEREGWQAEPVALFDQESSFYCLRKGEQTLLLAWDSEFGDRFTDLYVSEYALYEGRTLRSWSTLKPIDHRLADDFVPADGSKFSDAFESSGYHNIVYRFFFLDDCRVAACKYLPHGEWAESDFIILDLYEGK